MGRSNTIVILAVGFALGYEFTSQGERVSSAIEAGTITKSSVLKQFNEVMNEVSSDRKVTNEKSHERLQDQAPKIDLSVYTFNELTTALGNKRKKFYNESLKGYDVNWDEKEAIKRTQEKLFAQLYNSAETSPFWKATAEFSVAGESVELEIISKFYSPNANDFESGIDLTKVKEAEICQHAHFFFKFEKDKKLKANVGDCLSRIYKDDKYYMDLSAVDSPGLNHILHAMIIPYPGDQGAIEFLPAESKNWQNGSQISWTPLSRKDFDDLVNNKDDYEWVY